MWSKFETTRVIRVGPILDEDGLPYVVAGPIPYTAFLLSKNGAAGTNPHATTGAAVDGAQGHYRLTLDATDTGALGSLDISLELANYSMPLARTMVVPAATFNALITNAAGAAGGLPIGGADGKVPATMDLGDITGTLPMRTGGGVSCLRGDAQWSGAGSEHNPRGDMVVAEAYRPRIDTILAATNLSPTLVGTYGTYPGAFPLDVSRGLLLCGSTVKLYSINLESDYAATEIVDVHTHPTFTGAGVDADWYIIYFTTTASGTWLMFVGKDTAGGSGGKVFRSTDAGANWMCVLTGANGKPGGIRGIGSEWAWGTYVANTVKDVEIYYSQNDGLDWDLVQTLTNTSNPFHAHNILPTGRDELICILGDGSDRPHFRLLKPDGWEHDGGDWNYVDLPAFATGYGEGANYVYKDGAAVGISLMIMMWDYVLAYLDLTTYKWSVIWSEHPRVGLTNYTVARGTWCDPATGAIHLPLYDYGNSDGIADHGYYVTLDQQTFICVGRLPDMQQNWFHAVLGIYQGTMYYSTIVAGVEKIYATPALQLENVNAVRIERATTNVLSYEASLFETEAGVADFGGWSNDPYGGGQYASPYWETVTMESLGVEGPGHALHVGNVAGNAVYIYLPSWATMGAATPAAQSYITVHLEMWSPDIRAATGHWDPVWTKMPQGGTAATQTVYPTVALNPTPTRYILQARYVSAPTANDRIGLQFSLDAIRPGANIYIRNVMVQVSDAPADVQFNSFVAGGSTSENDAVSVALSGLTDQWSVAFDWIPNFHSELCLADVPVASILGMGGSYIDLSWSFNGLRLVLSDGTQFASAATQVGMRRLDLIRCVLVSDGINTILYTNDPVNGTTSVGAASGVNLTGIPMLLKLGTNHDETAWGRGHFFNVNQYDAVLTAVQVDDVFSKVGAGFNTSGIIVNETVKDGMAATAVIVNGMKATAISKDVWTDAKAAFVNASIAAIEPGMNTAAVRAAAAAALAANGALTKLDSIVEAVP